MTTFDAQRELPLSTRLICLGAKRYPFWKGRSRLLRLVRRSLSGSRPLVHVPLAGSDVSLDTPWDDYSGSLLVAFGEGDKELYSFLQYMFRGQKPDDVVFLDVGANLGIFALRIAQVFDIDCIAYEPQPDLAELLAHNAKANGLIDRLDIREVALGTQAGIGELLLSAQNCGNARVRTDSGGEQSQGASAVDGKSVTVRLARLADELTVEQWKRIPVLKIDVEGYEPDVFAGAKELFAEHRPTIVFEINVDELEARDLVPKDLGGLLRELGYDTFYALDERLYPMGNGMFHVSNVVAVGDNAEGRVASYGVDHDFTPKSKKMWPVVHYDF